MTDNLTHEQIDSFHRDGYVVIPSFYDRETEIEPIQRAIHGIIGMVIRRHALAIRQAPFSPETFDSGLNELVAVDRSYGGEVYDAVKLIPAFVRLAASKRNEDAVCLLRQTKYPGFISRGYGMRIDFPQEDHLRAHWHQEYLFQLRSVDGLIFWSPLLAMSKDLGPVIIGRNSHRQGIFPVAKNGSARGAYSWRLKNELFLASQYEHIAPLTNPGDVLIMDFLALHCSGNNMANRARWSMQMRFFNFEESTGFRHGWPGSVSDGIGFEKYHPECLAAIEEAA